MQVKSFAECSREHSAILSTFIKLRFAINIFVLSIFEWPLKTGFTVVFKILEHLPYVYASSKCSDKITYMCIHNFKPLLLAYAISTKIILFSYKTMKKYTVKNINNKENNDNAITVQHNC